MKQEIQSLRLSVILVRILFVFILVLCCCVPVMVHWYDTEYAAGVGLVSGSVYWPLTICLYLAAVCGEVCLWNLGRLLGNLTRDIVFVQENCRYLRVISWCCLLVTIPFGVFLMTTLDRDCARSSAIGRHTWGSALPSRTAIALSRQVS